MIRSAMALFVSVGFLMSLSAADDTLQDTSANLTDVGGEQNAALEKIPLSSATLPGFVLRHNCRYEVTKDSEISAADMPGVSALRVPFGAAVIIDIATNCTLRVQGGPGYGRIPGGAGIEVPLGAKLVITGSGKLEAYGGNAAKGCTGYGGLAGMFGAYTMPDQIKEEKMLPCPRSQMPPLQENRGVQPKDFCSKPLAVGRCGCGGVGGEGGGGAGAGIGGVGGGGGEGGLGGISPLFVDSEFYTPRSNEYWKCASYLELGDRGVYPFDKSANFRRDGEQGHAGRDGGMGRACGDVVIAGTVTVNAYRGSASSGGAGGPCGMTHKCYEEEEKSLVSDIGSGVVHGASRLVGAYGVAIDATKLIAGVLDKAKALAKITSIATKLTPWLLPFKGFALVEGILSDFGVFERSKLAGLHWYTGGGGGGGGAGGAAATGGIGAGGAGGGGGGGGGAGLFEIGVGSAFSTDWLGKPILTTPPVELSGHGGKSGVGYVDSLCGKDGGTAIIHDYSKGRPYNFKDGRMGAWTWLNSSANWAWGGVGASGGRPGVTNGTPVRIWRSSGATVTGYPPGTVPKAFGGALEYAITFMNGSTCLSRESYICGTLLGKAPQPVGQSGEHFVGYYTANGSGGSQYFDRYGNPVGGIALTKDVTLYARWTKENPDQRVTNVIEVTSGILTAGSTLEKDKVYHFVADVDLGSDNGPALTLSKGRTVFYIENGKRVVLKGCDAKNRTPACPGLEVPEGATLVVVGGGTLYAKGGKAAAGGAGEKGENGSYTVNSAVEPYSSETIAAMLEQYAADLLADGSNVTEIVNMTNDLRVCLEDPQGNFACGVHRIGKGGKGGDGGGGAAPGIGGRGGRGGEAPDSAFAGYPEKRDVNKIWGNDFDKKGYVGKPGGAGGAGGGMGEVYVLGGTVEALGGEAPGGVAPVAAVGGSVASEAGGAFNAWTYRTGGGGGGGGGGNGAQPACAIGGGGGGGGAGGSGGSGAYFCNKSWSRSPEKQNRLVSGGGGGGGKGGSFGTKPDSSVGASGKNADCHPRTGDLHSSDKNMGGDGADGGAGGAPGGAGYLASGVGGTVSGTGIGSVRMPEIVWGHPALERTITFTCEGRDIGSMPALMGLPLPLIPSNCLYAVKGYTFACAYEVKGGATNYWYGIEGDRLLDAYDGVRDVRLEVELMPRWEAMALVPDASYAVYGNSNIVAYADGTYPGCRLVDGVACATNAGVYSYRVGLKPGYEIWSDFSTADVRTVMWTISKVAITNDWKNNALKYDWTKSKEANFAALTNSEEVLGFKLPEEVSVTYAVTRSVAEGYYQVEARLNGGVNYFDRTFYGSFFVDRPLGFSLTSHYPWSTKLEVCIYGKGLPRDEAEATSGEWKQDDYEKFVAQYAKEKIHLSLPIAKNSPQGDGFLDIELGPVENLVSLSAREWRGVVDLSAYADNIRQMRSKGLHALLTIVGLPIDWSLAPVDTTAVAKDGWPCYTVAAPEDIYPIYASYRLAGFDADPSGQVLLSIGKDVPAGDWFKPRDATGKLITDGSLVWSPSGPGAYVLEHMTVERQGVTNGYARAVFNYSGEAAETTNIVATVERCSGITLSFTSFADAVASLEGGETLTVLGDVQLQKEKIPSGVTVKVGGKGVFRLPTTGDLKGDYYDVTNVVAVTNGYDNESGIRLQSCRYVLNPDKARPVITNLDGKAALGLVRGEDGKPYFQMHVNNLKEGLFYEVHHAADLSTNRSDWTVILKAQSDSTGSADVQVPASREKSFYSLAVTDNPMPAFETRPTAGCGLEIVSSDASVSGRIVVPTEIGERTVVSIAENAFTNRGDIVLVEMAVSLTNIGASAFADCTNLSTVVMLDGPLTIGARAFAGCAKLTSVVLPDGCTFLGRDAFARSGVKEVFVPASVQSGVLPALGVGGTVSVEFGANLTDLGTIPRTLEDGTQVAYWQRFDYGQTEGGGAKIVGCNHIGGGLLKVPASVAGVTVSEIGDCAFTNHAEIAAVNVPDAVQTVGAGAFVGCPALTNVTFGTGVKYVGSMAFGTREVASNIIRLQFNGNAPTIGGDLGLNPAKCTIYLRTGTQGWGAVPGVWQGCPTVYAPAASEE